MISILSEGEVLSGKGEKNFLSSHRFESNNLEWKTKERSKAVLKDSLKGVFGEIIYFDAPKSLNKSISLDEVVVSSKKISQKKIDYYLFLIPRDPIVDQNSSHDFFSNCTSGFCLPASLIYMAGYYSYKGINNLLRVFVDEKKEYKIEEDEEKFRFMLVGEHYKNFYRTRCFAGMDIVLIKNNEKKFIAYSKMNYDAETALEVDYKYFSSLENFSTDQNRAIKDSCLKAVSYSINRGLYNIGLVGSN